MRDTGTSIVFTDAEAWPSIGDVTGGIVYARLQRGDDKLEAAYPPQELDAWAARAALWAKGESPKDLPLIDPRTNLKPSRATCFSISSTRASCAHRPRRWP
jgi:uncharacterized protein YecE (DUF72 family)